MFQPAATFLNAFSVFFLGVLISTTACNRAGKRTGAPGNSSGGVETPLQVTPVQKNELETSFEARLRRDFEFYFAEIFNTQAELHGQKAQSLAKAAALSASNRVLEKVAGRSASKCVFSTLALPEYTKCLVYEVLVDDLSGAWGLRGLFEASLKAHNEPLLGNIQTLTALVTSLSDVTIATLTALVSREQNLEKLVGSLTQVVVDMRQSLEILVNRQATLDMPFLAKSFFSKRSFVLTTSLQQGSVGRERVYNLQSLLVTLSVNSGRLVVLRSGEGLFDSLSQQNLIVGAYPIVATRTDALGEEFYQIDFSKPENKQFLLPALSDGSPSLQISADVVVPHVAHAPKTPLPELKSGLYFNSTDENFVLDQLVLVNANKPFFDVSAETKPASLEKDELRPTVRVVQGFFALGEAHAEFEKTQSQDMGVAVRNLSAAGVLDNSQGKDVPYFDASTFLPDALGRARTPTVQVRKFNTTKNLVWVISESTPASAVPVIKSVVYSYREVFEKMAQKNLELAGTTPGLNAPLGKALLIEVLTQKEFEAAHTTEGLKIGGKVVAADPRVNMIYWDDNFELDAAWATTVANPKSGEVLSADVMLTGAVWAKLGCKAFFQRTWTKDLNPNSDNRPVGPVPSALTRSLWDLKCEQTMTDLGFYKPVSPTQADVLAAGVGNPLVFEALKGNGLALATQKADAVALAKIAGQVYGRPVEPSEMMFAADAHRAPDGDVSRDLSGDPDPIRALRAGAISKSGSSVAKIKEDVAERVKRLLNQYQATDASQPSDVSVSLSQGGNFARGTLDCVQRVPLDLEVATHGFSPAGVPAFETDLVKTPEDAALALLRSTLMHELGHTFGLRHNFEGSRMQAELASGQIPAMPLSTRTDSIMDYNDYGIDLDLGAMTNFKSATGALGVTSFGAYDLLALGTLYGLDTSSFRFQKHAAFCSDRNRSLLGNCQPYDSGNNYSEFLLYKTNMNLQRLRFASSRDFVFEPTLVDDYLRLASAYLEDMLALTVLWGGSQHDAALTSVPDDRKANLDLAGLAFYGVGARQDFVAQLPAKIGIPAVGVWDALRIETSFFADPLLGQVFSELIRSEMAKNVSAVADILRDNDKKNGLDSAFSGVIFDVAQNDRQYNFKQDLVQYFAQKAIVPADTALPFSYIEGGVRKLSSEATINGKPALVNLSGAFFNYKAQVIVVKDVEIEDGAGGAKKIAAIVTGRNGIADMMSGLAALSALAPGYELSTAVQRLKADRDSLRQMLGFVCESSEAVPCYALSDTAKDAASYVMGLYDSVYAEAKGL